MSSPGPAGFIDPTDIAAVERALKATLAGLSLTALLTQLATALPVRLGRPAGFLRPAQPSVLNVGQESLTLPAQGPGVLRHVVGGIVLSTESVAARALPAVLATLIAAFANETGDPDDLAVLLTALRDAAAAGRTSR